MSLVKFAVFLLVAVALWLFIHLRRALTSHGGHKPPPGPIGLPLIGSLHKLGKQPHRSLFKMSQKYGPIMSLRMGLIPTIVVSSPAAVELFLKTHDAVFANRPKVQATDDLYGPKTIAFSEFGGYWRSIRKFCNMELLSPTKVDSMAGLRREELGFLVESLKNAAATGQVVNVTEKVAGLIEDMTCRMLLGKSRDDRFNLSKIINEMTKATGSVNIADFIPFLAPLDLQVEVPDKLENVNINLKDLFESGGPADKKKCYQQFACMLSGLGTAKNLSFDLESIEALSEISKFLASSFSPFFNLKYVKLPKEYNQSTMSPALRSYLLNGSRGTTIVTSLPQSNGILRTPASVVAEKVAVHVPNLGDRQCVNETECVDTVDVGVREQYVIKNSRVDADRTRQTDAVVGGTGKDPVSSSKGNRDFGLWQGHEVNSDFVCLLDHIMHKYPETFEHFSTENKMLCTMNLNMLCTSLNDFAKISMAEVNSEIIVEYRDVFAYLQNQGFDVSWLVNRLNYIEHLRFSKPLISELHAIDYRIQDLQALRKAKMIEIQNAFGTIGTHLAAGSIGDDLLSGP